MVAPSSGSISNVPGPVDISLPDVDEDCRLLGPTALIVQAVMGIIVILSLLYKRYREKPQRAWRIWIFDVSKQIVGQVMLHLSNLVISDQFAHHASENPCVTYFLNILIDTTLGVALIYGLLHLFTYILVTKFHLRGYESGVYGDPPSLKYWTRQAFVYIVTLLLMKICVVALFALFPWLSRAGTWLLSWTGGRGAVQVVFVMGIFPIAMNVLQFWLIDSIVKFKVSSLLQSDVDSDVPTDPADREPLVHGAESDDDDDVEGRTAYFPRRLHSRSSSVDLEANTIPTIRPSKSRTPSPSSSALGLPEPKSAVTSSLSGSTKTSARRADSLQSSRSALTSPSPPYTPHIPRRSPPPSPSPAVSEETVGGLQRGSWDWIDEAGPSENGADSHPSGHRPMHPPTRNESWQMPVIPLTHTPS